MANQPRTFTQAAGEARRQASNVADAASTGVSKTAKSFETAVRDLVEQQPYTAVGIGIAIGWLLGRMHRPI